MALAILGKIALGAGKAAGAAGGAAARGKFCN